MENISKVSWSGEQCGIFNMWTSLKPYEKVLCPVVLFFKTLYVPVATAISWALAIPTLAAALLHMCSKKIPILGNILELPLFLLVWTSRILGTFMLWRAIYPYKEILTLDNGKNCDKIGPSSGIGIAAAVLDPTGIGMCVLQNLVGDDWLHETYGYGAGWA
jgi:hypothetical protein